MPLHLALDATSLLEQKTGVGVFVDEVLRRLAQRADIDLTAFSVTWRGRGRLAGAVPAGVRVISWPLPARVMREAWLRVDTPRLDRLLGRPDVIHGPNFVVPPSRGATVVSVHDLTPLRFPELANDDTRQYPELIRRAVRRGAWIHTDSDFVRGEVLDAFDVPAERVVTVPLGVRATGPGDGSRGTDLAGGDRYVLALGTVEPRKDLPSLVRAFDSLAARDDGLRLVIAGKDGWGTEALAAAIERSSHRERIVRVGYVSEDDRVALVRGATVYAYPSVYEGFGLPPLEAMSAGVPVVATDVGSLPEVLGDGASLVPAGDIEALAAAIERAAGDDAHRTALVARGREVVARWSWDRCVDGLVSLYERASGRAAATP